MGLHLCYRCCRQHASTCFPIREFQSMLPLYSHTYYPLSPKLTPSRASPPSPHPVAFRRGTAVASHLLRLYEACTFCSSWHPRLFTPRATPRVRSSHVCLSLPLIFLLLHLSAQRFLGNYELAQKDLSLAQVSPCRCTLCLRPTVSPSQSVASLLGNPRFRSVSIMTIPSMICRSLSTSAALQGRRALLELDHGRNLHHYRVHILSACFGGHTRQQNACIYTPIAVTRVLLGACGAEEDKGDREGREGGGEASRESEARVSRPVSSEPARWQSSSQQRAT